MSQNTKKAQNIWYYYKYAIIFVILLIIASVFFIKDYRKKKVSDTFYVMALEATDIGEEEIESLKKSLIEALDLNPSEEDILIETGYGSKANAQSEATIFAYMQSGRVDLMIAPEDLFNRYAVAGHLSTLSDAGVEEAAETQGEENIFYAEPQDYSGGAVTETRFAPHEKSENADAYGIYLTDGIFKGYVVGSLYKSSHPDQAREAILYMIS